MYRNYFLIAILFVSLGSLKAQNSLHQNTALRYYDAGLELLDKEKFGPAREQFERYLQEGKDEIKKTDAEYYVAFCALNLDNGDGAQLIAEFVKENPDHPKAAKAYYNLGVVSFKNKDYQNTVKYFKLVNASLLSGEERLEVNFKLGYGSYALRRYDEAAKYFDQAKRTKSQYYADANYYSGYLAYAQKEYDKSLIDFRRAEETAKYQFRVPIMIVSSYYQQKRYGELTQYASKFDDIQTASRRVDYLYQIYQLTAEAYYQEGQWEESVKYFELYEQLAAQSTTQETFYRMGYAYFQTGNQDKAIDNFKKVALNNDTLAQYASYYLGQLYVEQENLIFASSAFNKAATLDFNPEIKEEAAFNLAKVHFESDKYSQAIVALDRFMKQYPTSDYVPEANNLISEAFLNTNDYARAIIFIERIENKTQRIKEAYQKVTFYKGTEFYNAAKYNQAVQLFDKSLQYPIDKSLETSAHFWKGEAYATSGNNSRAIAAYKGVYNTRNRNSEYNLKADYGIAYAYYNSKDYQNARIYFKRYVDALERASEKQNYEDAMIRLADCYYVDKAYASTISYYDRAIAAANRDSDYAYFQKGVVRDFQDRPDEAIENLDVVINRFSNSRYYDDAIYKKAQIQLETRRFRQAIQGFDRIIARLPQSPFIPYAYQGRALANFNLEDYNKAEADYKTILDDYMTSRVANSALLGLQNTLKLQSKDIEFSRYLAKYRNAHPDNQQLESIEFEDAKNLYFSQKYASAIGGFEDYEKNYPESGLVFEAKYYRAECYYRLNDLAQALELFKEVDRDNQISGMDRVYERLGELELKAGNFRESANYYKRLEESSRNERQENQAWHGLLDAYYSLADYDNMSTYANKIIERGNISQEVSDKAQLYLGKAAYAKGDFNEALDQLLTTINTAKNVYGAEAQYMVGLIFFQQQQYQQSLNTLFEMNENYSAYDLWLGKGFLLIADNYIALKELFQAKATVNSIIEYSPVDEVVAEARQKLIEIEKLEPAENAADTTSNNNGN